MVTIDAIATNPTVPAARAVGGACVLALKRNRPSLNDEVPRYFDDPATTGLESIEITNKDHGSIETRTDSVNHDVDRLAGERRYPRFFGLNRLVRTTPRTECRVKISLETRDFIASARRLVQRAADATRKQGQIEARHWVLDVSPSRKTGLACAAAMTPASTATLQVRPQQPACPPRQIFYQTGRKLAAWDPRFLASILIPKPR